MSDKPRVLVVEDEGHLREALAYNFEYTGFEVIAVESAEEAINCVTEVPKQGEYLDVVTSDIFLPGKSGLEFLRLLRNLPDESLFASGLRVRYLPFVILSVAGSRNLAQISEIDRGVPIIDKPFSIDELLKTVSSAIGDYRHAILSELQFRGMGISWQNGQFQVVSAYTMPLSIESKCVFRPIVSTHSGSL
jgi:CheY-like chemotaxis protein